MANVKAFKEIPKIDGARGFALFPDVPEIVEAIEGTASKAAQFVVEHTGEEFGKFRKALQRHANSKGYTAQVGTTTEQTNKDGDPTGTQVQVALIPKVAGRPPKPDTADDATAGTPAAPDAVAAPASA